MSFNTVNEPYREHGCSGGESARTGRGKVNGRGCTCRQPVLRQYSAWSLSASLGQGSHAIVTLHAEKSSWTCDL
eukprot:2488516-Rhodomonas_salina.3